MVVLSLVFLVIFIFGALAYGSGALLSLRQSAPVWGPHIEKGGFRLDRVSMAMFVVCTTWFTLHAVLEVGVLRGFTPGRGWLDIVTLVMTFLFPPLIMHLVHHETQAHSDTPMSRAWTVPLVAMYVISPLVGLGLLASIFQIIPRPEPIGPLIGGTIGGLFILSSLYSTVNLVRRRRKNATPAERRLRTGMLILFGLMSVLFLTPFVVYDRTLLMALVEKLVRTTPLFFLILAIYFENRFAFYDTVVKRGAMLLATVAALGLCFALVLSWIDRLPAGAARPWIAAVLLAPIVMLMPLAYRSIGRWLDRMWFGRTFTAVDAVKHVLAAMQPATDERTLIDATEARLSEIFGAPITVLLDNDTPPAGSAIDVEVSTESPASKTRVRFAMLHTPGARALLSEDLAMLRSLAGVFAFMLENVRLQGKRQEQEQVATALRLQTSRSELKALRAQINPHFLFNALNAIASLIHTNPARADEAVEQLAEVFRYTLRRSDSEWAPLDQELAFARAYLDVERARFGQRLSCSIDSDHLPPVPQVPSMLLQTLIENAVKHGVSQTRGPGRIDVIVRSTSDQVSVEVRDNGPGPGATLRNPREGEGFGLRSVRERLAGHFGDRASLSLARDEAAGVTVARIIMPVVRVAA